MLAVDQSIQLAAAGDVAAFEDIYESHYRFVYSVCLRMTRNISDAEDLTQNVFVQLFRKLPTFRGDSSFNTWLYRLAVNEVLMHFRKPSVRAERTAEDESALEAIWDRTQDRYRMSGIDRICLEKAMRQLAPGYRAVLILHDVEGYEHQEIGKILGCAVGTSKSQLHKARTKLRQLLMKRTSRKQIRRPRSLDIKFGHAC